MRKRQPRPRRLARNRLEHLMLAITNSPEGTRLTLLPYLPGWLAPGTWPLWSSTAGTLLIVAACMLVALYSIRRNEALHEALRHGHDRLSITTLFVRHTLIGIGLSAALFLPGVFFGGA